MSNVIVTMLWILIFPAACLLLGVFICIEFKNYFSKDIRKVNKLPGPKTVPLLGNVFDVIDSPDNFFRTLRKWSKEYYPVYKVWVTNAYFAISMCAPEDMQTILSNPNHNHKSRIYEVLHDWLREGLLTSNLEKWRQRRKILTPTFHFNILKSFIQIFNKHAEECVGDFRNDPAKEVEILPHISKSALYTIAETAMGINLTNSRSEKKYRNYVRRIGEIATYRILHPWTYFRATYLFTSHFYAERYLLSYLQKFTKNVVDDRRKVFQESDLLRTQAGEDEDHDIYLRKKKKQLAMLDLLFSAKNRGEITDDGVLEEVDTFMFEGHDTVSMSLQFTLMLLANNGDVQQKVYEEVTTILDTNRTPTYDDINEMTYLEMVIKESLRLYPSVPLISRVSGDEFICSSGYKIPKGCILILNIFDTHRLEHLYPEPDKFIPERFTLENSKDRHPYAYLAFSAGSRNCIGRKYAMLNMKCKLAAIVQNFVLLPVDKPEDIILIADIVLRTKDKIKVQFKPRR